MTPSDSDPVSVIGAGEMHGPGWSVAELSELVEGWAAWRAPDEYPYDQYWWHRARDTGVWDDWLSDATVDGRQLL